MKKKYKKYNDTEYVVFGEDAINEVLFEHLMEYNSFMFSKKNLGKTNRIFQMLFDHKNCKCLYVLTTIDKLLPEEELDRLLLEEITTESVC